MGTDNRIRYYHFMAGVLAKQAEDPLCSICRAFENSVRSIRESLAGFEAGSAEELKEISPGLKELHDETRLCLAGIRTPVNAEGQKKAGRCKMPEGVCFVKTSKALIERI
ncbi:MAG: hypothetical protein EPN25_06105 [Nitrospirae bacterium]|nr:MAG: hypothetical protein EPN25_06105 [Nitrospirota bacterium]